MVEHHELKDILTYNPQSGEFVWNKNGQRAGSLKRTRTKEYWRVGLKGKTYAAHRLAWFYETGEWPRGEIDHINGNGLDNRFLNLREATSAENNRNRRRQSNNTSGFVGVSWCKLTQKWRAELNVNGERVRLGRFDTIGEAVIARLQASIDNGFSLTHGL